MKLRAFSIFLFVAVLMLAIPRLWTGADIFAPLAHIAWTGWLLVLALTLVRWLCLGLRFQLLLKHTKHPLPLWRVTATTLAADFAAEATPAATGGVLVWLTLFRKQGVPTATTMSIGGIVLLLDMLCVGGIVLAALLVLGSTTSPVGWLLYGLWLVLLTLLSLGFWWLLHPTHIPHVVLRWLACLPARWRDKLHDWLQATRTHLASFEHLPAATWALTGLCSLINWLIRFSMLFLALSLLGHTFDWPHAALIQFTGALAGMFTFLPAGYPAMDLSFLALLSPALAAGQIATVLVLWRLLTFYLNSFVGILCFLMLLRKS